MVPPFSLLRDMLTELNRIVEACSPRPVMIPETVPLDFASLMLHRQHCSNVRGADPASVDSCKKIMEDLATLNTRGGEFLQADNVSIIRTGDLITGRRDCPVILYTWTPSTSCMGSDTGHGDKIAYSKITIGLLDKLNKNLPESDLRHNLHSRKRSLDASPDFYILQEGG
jgi:hypothetical protein